VTLTPTLEPTTPVPSDTNTPLPPTATEVIIPTDTPITP
jgi:hypothetical protein